MIHDVTVISAKVREDPGVREGDGAVCCGKEFAKVVQPSVSCTGDGS